MNVKLKNYFSDEVETSSKGKNLDRVRPKKIPLFTINYEIGPKYAVRGQSGIRIKEEPDDGQRPQL